MMQAYDRAKKQQAAREERAKLKAVMTVDERRLALSAAGVAEKTVEQAPLRGRRPPVEPPITHRDLKPDNIAMPAPEASKPT